MEFQHTSILLNEVIEQLQIKPGGCYMDGTLGGGGHAYGVCSHLGAGGRYIGIDQDGDALEASKKRLARFGSMVSFHRYNYVEYEQALRETSVEKVDGILLDLGVSSYQLDNGARGFTYREAVRPETLSMNTVSRNCFGSSGITGKTGLPKILPNTS